MAVEFVLLRRCCDENACFPLRAELQFFFALATYIYIYMCCINDFVLRVIIDLKYQTNIRIEPLRYKSL